MVSQFLRGLFESGSYLDLLLIWVFYSLGWMIYIVLGHLFNRSQHSRAWHVENGILLGALCLITKGYLPPMLFQIVVLLGLSFIFRSSSMGWLRSAITAAGIDILVLFSDICFIQPVIGIPKAAQFITQTSLGVAVGTILESAFPLLVYIGYEVMIRCRKTKKAL